MQELSSLKKKTTFGMLWSFADLMANQGIQFILQVILARLLLPEHFGLIGMILVFIAVSNIIIDSGFSTALIREKNPSNEDYSTVFFTNLGVAIIIYVILFVLAKPISSFFQEPQLVSILRILSLGIIINSFGIVQRVFFSRNVDFRTQTKVNIVAGILSGVISVVLAIKGFGVWSLVYKTLSMQLIQVVLFWLSNRWTPLFVFNIESFKRLFGFSSKVLISSLIGTIYNNIYFIVIGRFFSATQLGYYTNAVKLRDVASKTLTATIQRVSFPVLSKIQDDMVQLRNAFKRTIRMTTFIVFPIMFGIAAIASPLINLFFGDKWMPSVIYLQLLCIEGILFPLHSLNLNILQVKGRSDLYLLLEIFKRTVMTILIIVALLLKTGIVGLIIAGILYSVITLFSNTFFSAREISYSIKEQLKDMLPMFLSSLLMGAIVYLSGLILSVNLLIQVILQVFIGIFVYIIISKLFKINELCILQNSVLSILSRVKKNIV